MVSAPLSMAAKLVLLLGLLRADVVLGYVSVVLSAILSNGLFRSRRGKNIRALGTRFGTTALRCGKLLRITPSCVPHIAT
jgi:hypothetical protein